MDFERISRLIKIVEASNIQGLTVKNPIERITITQSPEIPPHPELMPPPLPTKKERDMERRKMEYSEIKSPGVGIFYLVDPRVPKAKPYVKKGSKVKEGNVLALIFSLGLYDEISAPWDGKIIDIYVKDNSLVDYNKPLFKTRVKN